MRGLVKGLFDQFPPKTCPAPPWHLDEQFSLMDVIAEQQPDMPPEDRSIRAGTLFGAVHGVVSITWRAAAS